MPRHDTFPIWTRNRARRHVARGCSHRVVGLILGPACRRQTPSMAEAPPSNVLPFRTSGNQPVLRSAMTAGGDLRQG